MSEGDIHDHTISLLIKPFIQFVVLSKDNRLIDHAEKHIFQHMLKQSEAGIEHEERYNVWKNVRIIHVLVNVTY